MALQHDSGPDGRRGRTGLKIRKVRVRAVLSPLARPVRTAAGEVTSMPLALVDMDTDGGVTGHAYVFTYTQLALKPVCELLGSLGQAIAGSDLSPFGLASHLSARFRLLGDTGLVGIAIAGLEMAAWDALARDAGLPLTRLLGGVPGPVRCYMSVGMDGREQAERDAAEAIERGFKALKIKIGYGTLEEDLAVIRAAQSVLGGRASLMVDYNQSLNEVEALRRCAALDALGLAWIEEPLRHDDYAGHARLSARLSTPIQLGENWYGTAEMSKAVHARAAPLAMIDLMKIGGVSGWLRAAHLAEAAGLPLSSHIFQEVSAHLMCVTPTAHWLEYMPRTDVVVAAPLEVRDGMAQVRDAPGSGLEWAEEVLAKHEVRL